MKKLLILLGMLMLMGAIAYADTAPTCSIVAPASSSANTGTIPFNVSITGNGTGQFNITGVNFTVSNAVVGSSIAEGINLTKYGVNVDTSTITDIKQTTVTANIIINGTSYSGSCTSTLVDFDNTNPVCSQSLDFPQIEPLAPVTVDCSRSTDTTDITYSIVFTREDSSTVTETPTDGISIFDDGDTDKLGWATAVCTVTDEVAKTNTCTSESIWIGTEDPETPPPANNQPSQTDNKQTVVIIFGVVVMVLVLFTLIFWSVKGMKKKR